MYVKMDFILISKYLWLEAILFRGKQTVQSLLQMYMAEGSLSVNWPEKAGLFSVKFEGTQMLSMSLYGQTGPCPGKTQNCSIVMYLGEQERYPFKE